jgi:hypothetical protein
MIFDVSDFGMPSASADGQRAGKWRWQRPS